MTEVDISPGARRDLDRLTDFLIASDPASAAETTALIISAIMTLRDHPAIGRTVEHGLRELVISRGRSGYLALYRFDLSRNLVRILAIRHQREATASLIAGGVSQARHDGNDSTEAAHEATAVG